MSKKFVQIYTHEKTEQFLDKLGNAVLLKASIEITSTGGNMDSLLDYAHKNSGSLIQRTGEHFGLKLNDFSKKEPPTDTFIQDLEDEKRELQKLIYKLQTYLHNWGDEENMNDRQRFICMDTKGNILELKEYIKDIDQQIDLYE